MEPVASPFRDLLHSPEWRCDACGGQWHWLTSKAALAPFDRKHGFRFLTVPDDGDCFYSCISRAIETCPELAARLEQEIAPVVLGDRDRVMATCAISESAAALALCLADQQVAVPIQL